MRKSLLYLLSLSIRYALCLGLLALLHGCGWHLAGQQYVQQGQAQVTELNYQPLKENRTFNVIFEETMSKRGITQNTNAPLTLRIMRERMERKPYAYSSTGNPVQYQLELYVEYLFEPRHNSDITPTETITPPTMETVVSRRQFDFEADAVIAKQHEQESLKREMYQDLAERILAKAVIDTPVAKVP